jgi:predicted ribosomally synthesized peptide with SipW-like signal peptide
MTKKIILSLAMISLAIAGVTSATIAYFSDTARVSNNVFAMGTVTLGGTQNMPFELSNLAPGEISVTDVMRIQYTGSLPADLYFGLKHQSGHDLKEILQYRIERMEWVSGTGWEHDAWIGGPGWKNPGDSEGPFAKWIKIQTNLTENQWGNFKLHIKVRAGEEVDFPHSSGSYSVSDWNWYQGKSATNQVILYAVQTGSGYVPATPPYVY